MDSTLDELGRACRDIARLKRRVASCGETLLRLKTQLNMFTFISAMPPEVLGEIFRHCLCDHGDRSESVPFVCRDCMPFSSKAPSVVSAVGVRQALSEVCSSWKSFVTFSPRLWTTIHWNENDPLMTESFMRSAHMPLTIHMEIPLSAILNRQNKLPCKNTCRGIRSVLRRLYRIEDLTITNWADFPDVSLKKYTQYQAPTLRRLVITRNGIFTAKRPFPFILSSPCPALEFLCLYDCGIRSIQPALLPALQELYFGEMKARPTPPDHILSILEGLPQLKTLTLAQYAEPSTFVPPSRASDERTAVLPNLRSLAVVDYSLYLLLSGHLRAPVLKNICLQTQRCLWNTAAGEPGDERVITDWLANYASQIAHSIMSTYALQTHSGFKFSVSTSTLYGYLLKLTSCSLSPTEFLQLECLFQHSSDSRSPVPNLCMAIQPLHIREFELSMITDEGVTQSSVQKEEWMRILAELPRLEILRVSGEAVSRALIAALTEDYSKLPGSALPLQTLDKLALRPSLAAVDVSPQSRLRQDYVAMLAAALLARRKCGLLLRELEVDAEDLFTEDHFAPLGSLVTRMTLHRTKDRWTELLNVYGLNDIDSEDGYSASEEEEDDHSAEEDEDGDEEDENEDDEDEDDEDEDANDDHEDQEDHNAGEDAEDDDGEGDEDFSEWASVVSFDLSSESEASQMEIE